MSNQILYNDETLFPWGKAYKGKKFADVPASYFLWVYAEKVFRWDLSLHTWIEENLEALEVQAAEEVKNEEFEKGNRQWESQAKNNVRRYNKHKFIRKHWRL